MNKAKKLIKDLADKMRYEMRDLIDDIDEDMGERHIQYHIESAEQILRAIEKIYNNEIIKAE